MARDTFSFLYFFIKNLICECLKSPLWRTFFFYGNIIFSWYSISLNSLYMSSCCLISAMIFAASLADDLNWRKICTLWLNCFLPFWNFTLCKWLRRVSSEWGQIITIVCTWSFSWKLQHMLKSQNALWMGDFEKLSILSALLRSWKASFYTHLGCKSTGFMSIMELRREEWEYSTSNYHVTNVIFFFFEVQQFFIEQILSQLLKERLIYTDL